jgi:hypothetical protein
MDEMTWICPQCGLTNDGGGCRGCDSARPDYRRHIQTLNLGSGPVFNGTVPVFNGPVNVAVMQPGKALEGFYGREALEDGARRPTSWEQFTGFCIRLVLLGSAAVVGVVVMVFALLFLGAVFGW